MSRDSRKQTVEKAAEYLYEPRHRGLAALQKALQHARRRRRKDAAKPTRGAAHLKGIKETPGI